MLSSNISPVRSFGIMMGLATLLVLLAALLLLPGGILLGRLMADPGRVPGEGQLTRGLQSLARAIRRRPAGVLIGVGLLVGVAGAGLTRLEVETDFSENFRPDSPIRRGLDFFETELVVRVVGCQVRARCARPRAAQRMAPPFRTPPAHSSTMPSTA